MLFAFQVLCITRQSIPSPLARPCHLVQTQVSTPFPPHSFSGITTRELPSLLPALSSGTEQVIIFIPMPIHVFWYRPINFCPPSAHPWHFSGLHNRFSFSHSPLCYSSLYPLLQTQLCLYNASCPCIVHNLTVTGVHHNPHEIRRSM